jgi:hypothetical protein
MIAWALLGLLADVTGVGPGLVIASDSACPSAQQVRDALHTLVFPPPAAASVGVHADETFVTVNFVAPAGLTRGPRQLELPPDCDRRAATVSLLIAAWLGRLPTVPPPAYSTSALSAAEVALGPAPAEPPPGSMAVEVGGGIFSVPGTGPGLRLELGRQPARRGNGWRGVATIPTSQGNAGPGYGGPPNVHWIRPALSLEATARGAGRAVLLEGSLGPMLGLATAWRERTTFGLAVGANTAVRLAAPVYTGIIWVELRLRYWLTRQEVHTGTWATELPSAEAMISLGGSFAPGRDSPR